MGTSKGDYLFISTYSIFGSVAKANLEYTETTFFFYLVELEFTLRASHLQSRHSTVWATPLVHFSLVILEMGSQELFAYAVLDPLSS
jgi:hypothetical protein